VIARIVAFEPTRAKANPVVLLGYALLLVYVVISLVYLRRMAPSIEQASQGGELGNLGQLLARLNADPALQALLLDAPPLPGLFFYLSFLVAPAFLLLIAADQLGSEIRHKSIRFLLPRVSRRTLLAGRGLGGWLLWLPAVLVVVLPGFLVLGLDGSLAAVWLFGRLLIGLAIYGLPFVALMVLLNTFIPNGFLSYLTATGLWMVVAALATVGAWVDPAFGYAGYLMPTSLQYALMSVEPLRWLGGVAGALGYTAVFGSLAAWIFERRDL